ncbi:DUF418 domain-containing protein [Bacillus norwichensis]|uniref:DUF418 domain-containing protein n=1 Tax=Bacillus norwichensis TaxID=2762217 RepID=A0ABR8VLZ9_9BACI|nr:DUF418 domain-containing protein [Bacillus norwichensis]
MIAIRILILQMVFSSIWLKRFKKRPIELIWRIGIYGEMPQHYKKSC